MKVTEAWEALKSWAESQHYIDKQDLLAQINHLEWEYE